MADPRRVAAALQYQQGQQDPFDVVPVAGVKQPLTPNEMTWLDRLNNLSAGLGTGITNQLEGYKQMVAHPVQSAKDVAQAVGTMAINPSVIVDALKGMGEKAASGSQGLGEVVGENMTLNPRKLAMALSHPSINELTVYHGTPHKFEKFDASKIGTGEGAQAYGHGLYFAESPEVANAYREALSNNVTVDGSKLNSIPSDSPIAQAHNNIVTAMTQQKMTPQEAISHTVKYWNDAADEMNGFLKTNPELADRISKEVASRKEIAKAASQMKPESFYKDPGSLYHVDLPDPMIERMLDWDKPLSEQPESVRKALSAIQDGPKYGALRNKAPILDVTDKYTTAGEAYRALAQELNGGSAIRRGSTAVDKSDKLAAEFLRNAGIPGIKYLDEGSRAAGKGTRNFVVFPGEESNLKILERK